MRVQGVRASGQERPVIVSELKAVLTLDPGDLSRSQAGRDVLTAEFDETTGRRQAKVGAI